LRWLGNQHVEGSVRGGELMAESGEIEDLSSSELIRVELVLKMELFVGFGVDVIEIEAVAEELDVG
jgi:hypothetical protein